MEVTVTLECWCPVEGYESEYEVSDMGKVRSKERRVRSGQRNTLVRARILKQFHDDRGYPMVRLCKAATMKTTKVHRLVAKHYVLGFNRDLTVNHIDMNKSNNAAVNLEWVSREKNIAMAWESGTHDPYRNPKIAKKMTPKTVSDLRLDHDGGESYRALGRKYGITHKTARAIVLGLSWTA